MRNSILPKVGAERKEYWRHSSEHCWVTTRCHPTYSLTPLSQPVDVFWFLGRHLACPLSFLWVRKFSLNPEELWWQERRLSLLSAVLRRNWEGWEGTRGLLSFRQSWPHHPFAPHRSPCDGGSWLYCSCLFVFGCYLNMSFSFHLSFSSNWSPLPSLISPHSLSVALSVGLW